MANSGRKTGRTLIIIAILLIVLVAAATFVFLRFRPLLQPNQPGAEQSPQIQIEEMVDIVITSQSVSRGEVIESNVVVMIPYPKNELVEGTFYTSMESVVGKKALYPLEARIPITPGMLIDGTTGGSIPALDIPVDRTALSIILNEKDQLIAYAPQAGDHVMVIGCMMLVDVDPEYQSVLPNYTGSVSKQILTAESSSESLSVIITSGGESSKQGRTELDPTLNEPVYIVPSEAQRPRLVCQNVIQDAIVLRAGDFPINGVEPTPVEEVVVAEGEEAPPTPELPPAPDIVTLAVSPQDAVVLTYMRKANIYITLALRNPNNDQIILTDAVTQQYLMDQKNIPLPAKLPFAIEPFRGEAVPAPTDQ